LLDNAHLMTKAEGCVCRERERERENERERERNGDPK